MTNGASQRGLALPSAPHAVFRLAYDRQVFALGSRLVRPPIPGLRQHAFDVDTYDAAMRLGEHLSGLARKPPSAGRDTVLVIGAGLTGIEAAAEMPARLRAVMTADPQAQPRVILADRSERIGSTLGEDARSVIEAALASLPVETRPGVSVASIDSDGAILADGERIHAATVVWCAGIEASPLTAGFPRRLPSAPRRRSTASASIRRCRATGRRFSRPQRRSCRHLRPMARRRSLGDRHAGLRWNSSAPASCAISSMARF